MHTTFPTIAPGRIHRWGGAGLIVARRPALHQATLPAPAVSPLSPDERHVHDALPPWRQAEWVAGRLLAKHLIGELVAAPTADVEILPRGDGSPQVVVSGSPAPALHVSISHTACHVAAALAPDPVGVDLCETTSAAAVRRVADRVLTSEERSLTGMDRPDVMAASWALKEAAVKAERLSIFGDAPRRITILGLCPPALSGPRRAMVWHTGAATVALVLTRLH